MNLKQKEEVPALQKRFPPADLSEKKSLECICLGENIIASKDWPMAAGSMGLIWGLPSDSSPSGLVINHLHVWMIRSKYKFSKNLTLRGI